MNFAAFNFTSALPRGFTAALLALVSLAVTGEATGPRAHVNGACGAAPHDGRLAQTTVAIFGAREARHLPASLMGAGFGVTKKAAVALRGRGDGNFPGSSPGSVYVSPAREALPFSILARGVAHPVPTFLHKQGLNETLRPLDESARIRGAAMAVSAAPRNPEARLA